MKKRTIRLWKVEILILFSSKTMKLGFRSILYLAKILTKTNNKFNLKVVWNLKLFKHWLLHLINGKMLFVSVSLNIQTEPMYSPARFGQTHWFTTARTTRTRFCRWFTIWLQRSSRRTKASIRRFRKSTRSLKTWRLAYDRSCEDRRCYAWLRRRLISRTNSPLSLWACVENIKWIPIWVLEQNYSICLFME